MGPELVVSSPQPVKVPLTVLLLWAPAFPSVGRCAPPQSFISKSPEAFSGQPCRLAPHLHVETYKAVGNLETLMSVSERNCYGHTDGGSPSCFLVFIVPFTCSTNRAGAEPASVLHHFSVGSLQWLNGPVRMCFRTQPSRTEYRCPGAGPRTSP